MKSRPVSRGLGLCPAAPAPLDLSERAFRERHDLWSGFKYCCASLTVQRWMSDVLICEMGVIMPLTGQRARGKEDSVTHCLV